MIEKHKLYSPMQLARVTGIGHKTIYKALHDGELPSMNVGDGKKLQHKRITGENWLAFIEKKNG